MSKKRTFIAAILSSIIIIIIIGIGISIASANQLALAQSNLNAADVLNPDAELRGLVDRGGSLGLESHLKELDTAKHQLLSVDLLKQS